MVWKIGCKNIDVLWYFSFRFRESLEGISPFVLQIKTRLQNIGQISAVSLRIRLPDQLLIYASSVLTSKLLFGMTAVWDTAPCSLVEVDRRFTPAYCFHHQGDDRHRRLLSLYSPSWELVISQTIICFSTVQNLYHKLGYNVNCTLYRPILVTCVVVEV
jgi:hypothetical protein